MFGGGGARRTRYLAILNALGYTDAAIDRSRLTQEHLDYVIAAVKALYEDRESIPNMRIVWGHKLPMRHFHAFLEPYANEEK